MKKTEISLKKIEKFYEDLNKLTKESGLTRGEIIANLEIFKLDLIFNDGKPPMLEINGKVGITKNNIGG